MKIPNIAAVSKLEAAFSYGAIKSSEIKNFTEMDRRKVQMEMVAESMNDDFSRHLSAAIGCLVRETVKEVVAEMEDLANQNKASEDMMTAIKENAENTESNYKLIYAMFFLVVIAIAVLAVALRLWLQ